MIPNVKMHQDNRAVHLSPGIIPSPEEAVASYQQCGGQLTLLSTFGEDPLSPSLDATRQQEFSRKHAGFHSIFHAAVNGDEHPFITVHLAYRYLIHVYLCMYILYCLLVYHFFVFMFIVYTSTFLILCNFPTCISLLLVLDI